MELCKTVKPNYCNTTSFKKGQVRIDLLSFFGQILNIKVQQKRVKIFCNKKNIAQICELELEEIPHCDTINDVFKNIKVSEIEAIRKYMIVKMIRSKMLEKYKIRGQYYHIIVDGTGLATSRKNKKRISKIKNNNIRRCAICK